MKSWYWERRWQALQHRVQHAERRVVDPRPDHTLDDSGQRPGEDHDRQDDAPAAEAPLEQEPERRTQHEREPDTEQDVPAGVLEALADLRVGEDGREVAEPCEVVRRGERVDVHERVDRRENCWVQRQGQDEDEQRCDHGVAHGLRPARTSAGEPWQRSAPTRGRGLRHAPPSSRGRGPGRAPRRRPGRDHTSDLVLAVEAVHLGGDRRDRAGDALLARSG